MTSLLEDRGTDILPSDTYVKSLFWFESKYHSTLKSSWTTRWQYTGCTLNVRDGKPHESAPLTPSYHSLFLPPLPFTVRATRLKLLKVFLERCRTKAPSTSLFPTCWLAFSTPVRTLEPKASHSSGKNMQTDSWWYKTASYCTLMGQKCVCTE